ncbi:MAG TPA: type II toxin-antitoxin system VapC family toxin [Chloroflexota bacterium]|jgi:predicted nucleic acid-binding protein
MSADRAYLDSSAFVKLASTEVESEALQRYLRGWLRWVSSALLQVEVLRALRPLGPDTVAAAREQLEGVELIAIDNLVLERAATISPGVLRSLDAIHLATAQQLGTDLGVLVTYDHRLAQAAAELGLPVAAPA